MQNICAFEQVQQNSENTIGAELRQARKSVKLPRGGELTQTKAVEQLPISRRTLQDYEALIDKAPEMDILRQMMALYNAPELPMRLLQHHYLWQAAGLPNIATEDGAELFTLFYEAFDSINLKNISQSLRSDAELTRATKGALCDLLSCTLALLLRRADQ